MVINSAAPPRQAGVTLEPAASQAPVIAVDARLLQPRETARH
jgi:hypothetical protein